MVVNNSQFGLGAEEKGRQPTRQLSSMYPDLESVGNYGTVADIAGALGVRSSAVSNWTKRHEDFPAPHMILGRDSTRQTGVWDLDQVKEWHANRGASPTTGSSAGVM